MKAHNVELCSVLIFRNSKIEDWDERKGHLLELPKPLFGQNFYPAPDPTPNVIVYHRNLCGKLNSVFRECIAVVSIEVQRNAKETTRFVWGRWPQYPKSFSWFHQQHFMFFVWGLMVAISELLAFYTLKVKTFRHATWRREKPMASKPLSGETTKIDKQLNLRACIWRGKIWKCHSPFSHVGESDRSKSLGRSSIFYQFYEIKTCIIHVYAFILLCHQSLPLQTLCAFFCIRHLRILLGWPCLRLWHGKSGTLGGSCENKWSRCAWPPLRHAHVQGKVSLTITFVLLFMLIWCYLIVCFLIIFWCFLFKCICSCFLPANCCKLLEIVSLHVLQSHLTFNTSTYVRSPGSIVLAQVTTCWWQCGTTSKDFGSIIPTSRNFWQTLLNRPITYLFCNPVWICKCLKKHCFSLSIRHFRPIALLRCRREYFLFFPNFSSYFLGGGAVGIWTWAKWATQIYCNI